MHGGSATAAVGLADAAVRLAVAGVSITAEESITAVQRDLRLKPKAVLVRPLTGIPSAMEEAMSVSFLLASGDRSAAVAVS